MALSRSLHVGLDVGHHLVGLALQQPHRLLHGLAVPALVHLPAAVAVTLAHPVVEAGPLLTDVPGELFVAFGQLQRPPQGLDDIIGGAPAPVGAEVPGPVLRHPAHHGELGVGVPDVQADVGVALVVFEEDVVMGLVALDEGALQHQGLELRVGDDHVEVVDLGDHGPGLLRVGGQVGEILAHPVLQGLGLAHVDDLVLDVLHDIHAGLQGQVVGFLFEFFKGHPITVLMFPRYQKKRRKAALFLSRDITPRSWTR